MIDISWQDLTVMVSGFIFCGALLPTIWYQFRVRASTVPVSTSLTTAAALAVLLPVYASLGLWIGTAVLTGNLLLWLVVMAQRVLYKEGA